MESGTTELSNSAATVDQVVQKTRQSLFDRLVHIPISENTAKSIRIMSEQFDAPALQKLRSTLETHADTIGKTVAVGSTVVDITLATVCASLSVGMFRDTHRNSDIRERRIALVPLVHERTGKPFIDATMKTATKLAAGSGSLILLRPVSRLVSWEAQAGTSVAEHVGRVINTIAGGKQTLLNPA